MMAAESWSGRRESNPRHTAWEAVVLPLNYARAFRGSSLSLLSPQEIDWAEQVGQPLGIRESGRQSPLGEARGWPSDFSVRRQSESALRALLDEVDGARPGLIAVGLHHAHIDRKIRPFREADRVDERDVSGPVVFRQAVGAQPSTKIAAFGLNEVVPQRRELDLARHDIRFEAKRAAGRVVEPEIDAGEVAGCHRAPRRGPRRASSPAPCARD